MKKLEYREPDLQVLFLVEEDVIAASGNTMSNAGDGDGSDYDWSDFFDEDF